ncbi:MAG: hypothetical protein Fur0042_11070 [Cyanophyceae cyanobacterium]
MRHWGSCRDRAPTTAPNPAIAKAEFDSPIPWVSPQSAPYIIALNVTSCSAGVSSSMAPTPDATVARVNVEISRTFEIPGGQFGPHDGSGPIRRASVWPASLLKRPRNL